MSYMCVCVRPSRIPTCLRALCICMYVPVDVRRDILAHLSHLYFNTHVVPFFLPSFPLPFSFLSPSFLFPSKPTAHDYIPSPLDQRSLPLPPPGHPLSHTTPPGSPPSRQEAAATINWQVKLYDWKLLGDAFVRTRVH